MERSVTQAVRVCSIERRPIIIAWKLTQDINPHRGRDYERRMEALVASIFSNIDDKQVPLYRILWISEVPHFCGNEECQVEGRYEIKLEADESVFGTREERDATLASLEAWHRGGASEDGQEWS